MRISVSIYLLDHDDTIETWKRFREMTLVSSCASLIAAKEVQCARSIKIVGVVISKKTRWGSGDGS